MESLSSDKKRKNPMNDAIRLNPPKQISASSLAPSESSHEKKPDVSTITSSTSRSFSCSHCYMKFSTPRALGGHKKAHKQKEVIKDEKLDHHDVKNYNMLPSSDHFKYYQYHPYSTYNYQNQPHHLPGGSSFNSSLNKPDPQPHYLPGGQGQGQVGQVVSPLEYNPGFVTVGGSSFNSLLNRPDARRQSLSSQYLSGNHIPSGSGVMTYEYEYKPRMESMQSQTVPTSLFDRWSGKFTNVKHEQEEDAFQPKNSSNSVKNRTSLTHELNLFNPPKQIQASSLPPSELSNEKKPDLSTITSSTSRSFSCRHCPRKFSTAQALGGHQNAHREKRKAENNQNQRHHLPGGSSFNSLLNKPDPQPHHLPAGGSSFNSSLNKPDPRWQSLSSQYLSGNHIPSWSGVMPYEYEYKPRIESMQPQTVPDPRWESLSSRYLSGNHIPSWSGVMPYEYTQHSTTPLFDRGSGMIDFMGGPCSWQPTHKVDSAGMRNFINLDQEDASGLDLNLKL